MVIACFNDLVIGKAMSGCLDSLTMNVVDATAKSTQLDVAWVSVSFALPLVVQKLVDSGLYQVVITMGPFIRGDTPHFDLVVAETSKSIALVTHDTGVPVIFGVLSTDTM